LWGIVGLIHDFDYERWPSLADHPYKGNEIFEGAPDTPDESAAPSCRTPNIPAFPARHAHEKASLRFADELAGFIHRGRVDQAG